MAGDKSTRHASSVALILVDVINDFEFPDGDKILKNALPMAHRLAKLKLRCRSAGIPSIYVNDNFGRWRSNAQRLLSRCLESHCAGRAFVQLVQPDDEDYFVLKPMHSAFFQTPLEILLHYLGATSLIVTGLATNSCVLCTAHDAKMRNFGLYVPSDCSAARTWQEHEQAIKHIKEMTGASVAASSSLRMGALHGRKRSKV